MAAYSNDSEFFFNIVPRDGEQLERLAYDLLRGSSFRHAPGEDPQGLYISLEKEDPKPQFLASADYVFIDPMVLYGFEVLSKGLL